LHVPGRDAVTRPGNAVFLSYASEDAEAAQRICDALRGAGIEVWFDKSELRGGDAWDRRIREQIHGCRLFIPIISTNSEARDEGYFRREWKLAADRTHDMSEKKSFVLPVVIDSTRERGAAVPDKFHDVQWTRLPGGETTPAFVTHVAGLLAQAATSTAPGAIEVCAAVVQPAPSRLRWLVAAAVIAAIGVVLATGYMGLERFALSKRGTVAPVRPSEKSIAVLPFLDMSEKHDQEYFADGMAEEILNRLMKLPELRVIGRTSSFSFKGKQVDLPSVGRALGVAYLMEGSIRRSGDHIRVTAQLIDARDGSHRWSDTFEGATSDTLNFQDEIAVRVARSLDLELSSGLPSRAKIDAPEAYDYYLRGTRELDENSAESLDAAREHFQKALALAPQFAPAAVGVAEADQFKCVDGVQPDVACPRALVAADAALKLDPRSADAYAVRAQVLICFRWDWVGAAAAIAKATEFGGGQSTDYAAARLAYATGDMARARPILQRIMANDPFEPDAKIDMGFFVELRSGRFREAESWLRRGLQISPRYVSGRFMLGVTQLMQGKLDEALASMREERIDEGQLSGLTLVYTALKRTADADASLEAMRKNAAYSASDFASRGAGPRLFQSREGL
jgi:TolB-like protein